MNPPFSRRRELVSPSVTTTGLLQSRGGTVLSFGRNHAIDRHGRTFIFSGRNPSVDIRLKQTPPDHSLVLLVREDPADDVAWDELVAGIALHVEGRRTVRLDVGALDAAEARAPALEVREAQVDPPLLRVTVDRLGIELRHGASGRRRRDADARTAGDGQLDALFV